MRNFILFLLLAAACPAGPVYGQSQHSFKAGTHYLWPTEASPYLSATFGETRSEHFHAALDIKTWGRKGYRVFAARDGLLHRIAISPKGYGKVIYLKHADGSYSVYAHLLKFNREIQQLADSIRLEDYSFELDREVDSLDIRVKQGDVIGYSGASGVGPPHLHFELRTPSNKPFNPLLTNLSVPDEIPPAFSGITVEPLAHYSTVENNHDIYLKSAFREQGGFSFGTINVSGPVGLGIDVFDQANRVPNAYAVYELKMYADDKLIFHSRADSFSYDQTGQLFLDRVYPVLRESGNGYQRLYLTDGNTLPFYLSAKNRGVLDLAPGTHHLRITATDYYGNQSEARVTLNVDEPQQVGMPEGLPDRPFSTVSSDFTAGELDRWQWHPDWIRFNDSGTTSYQAITIDSSRKVLPKFSSHDSVIDLKNRANIILERDDGKRITLRRIIPERSYTVMSNETGLFARFRSHTFYDTLSVALQVQQVRRDSIKIELYPNSQPPRREFNLTYLLERGASDSTLMFYYLHPRKETLKPIPTVRAGTVLRGTASRMGTYFVLSDSIPPELSDPRIYRREDGKWLASVDVRDNRSEIQYSEARFYVNGVRGIAEYEPENNRLIYYLPDFSPARQNILEVTAVDRAGNRVSRRFRIEH